MSESNGKGKVLRKDGKKISYKAWLGGTLALLFLAFGLFAGATIYIDPLFHYHAPLQKYEYPIDDQRYQNDGILKNFHYDGVITGTSMTENFKKSEADCLFGATFIKVPFSGASNKEIRDNLEKAFASGNQIRFVIRSLDDNYLAQDKDYYQEYGEYPTYLYNDNPFDDVNYVLNKEIFFERTCRVISYTKAGNQTTDFDEYASWSAVGKTGAERVIGTYPRGEDVASKRAVTQEERVMIQQNIRQNIVEVAKQHPETLFYLFFPPYSICYWDFMMYNGHVDWCIDVEKLAIEEILKAPNIRLYSFNNRFDLICDLDQYIDRGHYGEWVNSWILEWMQGDEYLLTEDNYQEYIQQIREFYNTYDYKALRE